MFRTVARLTTALTAAVLGVVLPGTSAAQKALVYCPAGIDAIGCNNVSTALSARYAGGVDLGYDGTNGTVDLKTVDLWQYQVIVVPSLADNDATKPYALLRDATASQRLRDAVMGRVAMWSGTPDLGTGSRDQKNTLLGNLAAWASANYATVKGPGLVVLQDQSATTTDRYNWVPAIAKFTVIADPKVLTYASVKPLTATGTTIVGSLAYTNMASYGFQLPQGAAGVALDAIGQTGTTVGGQVVLLTSPGGNSGGAVVKTDVDDYAPGTTVVMTGTGWQPGETVSLTLHEDPLVDPDRTFTTVADASGNISYTGFAPEPHNIDVRFILTASGGTSKLQAQTTFTDAASAQVVFATAGLPALTNVTVTASWTNNGGNLQTAQPISFKAPGNSSQSGVGTKPSTSFTYAFPSSITAAGITYNLSTPAPTPASPFTTGADGSTRTITGTYVPACTPPSITTGPQNATKTVGDGVTFSVAATGTAPLTYQWRKGSTDIAGATGTSYNITSVTTADAGTYAVVVTGACSPTATASATLTVNKATPTVVATGGTFPYDGQPHAATATVTGVGGVVLTSPPVTFTYTKGTTSSSTAPTDAGTYSVVATYPGNADYNQASSTAVTLTIGQRSITVTADANTKVYGDADPALTYKITSGSLVGSDALSGTLTRAPGESVAGSPYAILQGSLTAGTNYSLAFVSANFTITARPITVTADPQSKTYGDADPALTYKVTSGSLRTGDSFSGSLTRVAGENIGTYAIQQGTLTAGTNYNLSFVGANLTIGKRPITVTADAQTKVYGDADPALSYKVTSGNLVGTDQFTGGLTRAPGDNVGSYAISQGTLALSDNYTLTFTGASLTIGARPITVTADAKTKVYGDADPPLSYKVTAGSLAFSDAFAGALTRVSGESVGSYAIQQGTLALSTNYSLTYVGASLAITVRPVTITADAKTKVYGEADPALTYQVTSGSLAFNDAVTGALTRDAGDNVGAYAIKQGTVALSANYQLTFVGANLSITARPITVTAYPKTKVYGEADPPLTYKITVGNLVGTDQLTGSLTRDAGETVAASPYAIKQGTLDAGSNYALTFVGADFTITARPITVTADAQTKVYGNTDPAFTYKVTSGNLVNGDQLSGALTRVAGESVAGGPYAIQQGSLTAGTNYALTFVGANLTITPRPITVTADSKTKVYGYPDPALTFQLTTGSLAFSDAFTGALSRVPGDNVGTYAIQQGTLSAGTNYDLKFIGANLEITKRPVTVTADAQTKVYGEADPALTYKLTVGTLVGSDQFSGALSRATGENVGTYAISLGSLTLGGNYDITFVAGASLEITKRPITVTADAQTRVYGNPDPALTYKVTTGSLAFSDAFTGALTRAAGENVGSYAIQQGTLALSANYDLSFVGANLAITQRPITVTADAKTKTYGDADPALTYKITSGNLVFTDAFTGALTRAAGEDAGTYAIQQGTLTAGANYNLAFVSANLTINKAKPVFANLSSPSIIQGRITTTLGGNLTAPPAPVPPGSVSVTLGSGGAAVTQSATIGAGGSFTSSFSTDQLAPSTYAIAYSYAGSQNYEAATGTGLLTVTPNAKPVITAFSAPVSPVQLGSAITATLTFTDADPDESRPYNVTIDWGDGSTPYTSGNLSNPTTLTPQKTYGAANVYRLTATVSDKISGNTVSQVFEYVVVFDPNGPFVTGGGWINSPAGAYIANTTLSGKATFGFVSKYLPGRTTPSGNTEFQFHAASLAFKSTVYEWLVVSGARAQYKGSGTINGAGDFGFLLTAIDGQTAGGGGTDKFRIKIWNKATGAIVYDNQVGATDTSDTADPVTVLGGGSIQIQSK